MKKGIFAIIAVLTVFALVMTGCDTGSSPSKPKVGTAATITFDGNGNTGGTVPSSITDKTVGDTIPLPGGGDLEKTGSVFDGWSESKSGKDSIPPNGNYEIKKTKVTLYAVWGAAGGAATVTFDGNGNTGGTAPAQMTGTVGGTITLPRVGSLVKTGSTFGGWAETNDATTGTAGGSGYTIPKATVTLYAVWTATPPNSNATLTLIKIGDVEKNALAGKDTVAEAATNLAEISLTSNTGTVTITAPAAFLGTTEIAKVAKGGSASATFAAYVATTSYTFTDGDEIYVKMIAQDTTTVKYYGFEVGIGRDATPEKVTFDDQEPDELGTPKPALADAVAGHIMMLKAQTAKGFTVTVTKKTGQTVSFGKVNNTTPTNETGWSDAAKDIFFNAGEFLGVKVVSANGNITNYYKIGVELQPTMDIGYGTPKLYNTPEKTDKDYVDTLWNAIEWVPIANQNRAETNQEFFDNPSTSGRAKVYWDADGLWLYVDVTTAYVSTQAGSAGDHDSSNVELFINERTDADGKPVGTSGAQAFANGGQYRLAPYGDGGGTVTGDPAAAVTALTTLGKYKTWKTSGGYAVMFQAPWRVTDTYPLKDGKQIGLEIQINAAGSSGSRIGVLKWYNTTGNTYQNSTVLAPATLKLNGNVLPLQKPAITTQPENKQVPIGGTIPALTVAATPPEGATLSYKWYKAASATVFEGATEVGTDSASYTPVDLNTTVADFFYYVVVTATKGTETSTLTSTMARIQIYDPAVTPVDIELVKTTDTRYDATLGGLVFEKDGGWGAYSAITEAVFLVPSNFTPALYSRIEFVYAGYKADGSQATSFGNQYNLDFRPHLISTNNTTGQDFGNNASTAPTVADGFVSSRWNITASWGNSMDFTDGQGNVTLYAMNKTNTSTSGVITKLVVKSIKLVLRNP